MANLECSRLSRILYIRRLRNFTRRSPKNTHALSCTLVASVCPQCPLCLPTGSAITIGVQNRHARHFLPSRFTDAWRRSSRGRTSGSNVSCPHSTLTATRAPSRSTRSRKSTATQSSVTARRSKHSACIITVSDLRTSQAARHFRLQDRPRMERYHKGRQPSPGHAHHPRSLARDYTRPDIGLRRAYPSLPAIPSRFMRANAPATTLHLVQLDAHDRVFQRGRRAFRVRQEAATSHPRSDVRQVPRRAP